MKVENLRFGPDDDGGFWAMLGGRVFHLEKTPHWTVRVAVREKPVRKEGETAWQ